jgi:hypothetical protein
MGTETYMLIMKKLQFKVSINAPVTRIYDFMLGINSKSTYEQWTALFNPTSTYEGSWDKGSKILFIGVDEKGEKGGMVSRIVENIPNRFVSIQHYGLLKRTRKLQKDRKWKNGQTDLKTIPSKKTRETIAFRAQPL